MGFMLQIQVFQAADDTHSGWQMLKLAKLQLAPQIIYTSSRADSSLIQELQQPYEAVLRGDSSEDVTVITPQVRLEKAAFFDPKQVKHSDSNPHRM